MSLVVALGLAIVTFTGVVEAWQVVLSVLLTTAAARSTSRPGRR